MFDFVYNEWFLYYWLPVLIHLTLCFYVYSIHQSEEFLEYIKDHKAEFESQYYPVDEAPRIAKYLTILSFIPLINILSSMMFVYFVIKNTLFYKE